jgi:hypothetical protein
MCEACAEGRHWQCGMQSWCDCDCDPDAFFGDIADCDNGFGEPDEFEEALANCSGSLDSNGVFRCGAAGSEDCDWECPFSRDLGLTAEQIEERDEAEELEAERKRADAISKACDPWFSDEAFR